ncbi:MAG TPA: GNAT family N-acetyltransferase [Gaiellaceae bacterium]|nr:GNAT family N-acetyltransferase [Gaiellaceae bacterium]
MRAALEPVAGETAQALLAAYVAEIERTLERHRASSPEDVRELAPPGGGFVILRDEDGRAIGCGGFRRLEAGVCEVKRMYVAPEARGRGAGRLLLATIEAEAAAAGYRLARLDTAAPLLAARRLYAAAGWRETEPYNGNPLAAHWFAKELQSITSAPSSSSGNAPQATSHR